MSNLCLGVMDSGMGGLTVVDLLHKKYPEIKIVFLGDNANMPYGDKTKQQIMEFVKNNISFLSTFSIDGILIACNTMDSNCYQSIKDNCDIKLYPIIQPTCQKAFQISKNKKIAVLATAATVKSNAYKNSLERLDRQIEVKQINGTGLVELIEQNKNCQNLLEKYLSPLKNSDYDTLILGCTHYPLLSDKIKAILPNIQLVSSSEELVNSLQITKRDNLTVCDVDYYVTANPQLFNNIASNIFGYPINAIIANRKE